MSIIKSTILLMSDINRFESCPSQPAKTKKNDQGLCKFNVCKALAVFPKVGIRKNSQHLGVSRVSVLFEEAKNYVER